ncbi:MAG: hypothetical protein AAB590_03110 [Patescibacteria group bacterium]
MDEEILSDDTLEEEEEEVSAISDAVLDDGLSDDKPKTVVGPDEEDEDEDLDELGAD